DGPEVGARMPVNACDGTSSQRWELRGHGTLFNGFANLCASGRGGTVVLTHHHHHHHRPPLGATEQPLTDRHPSLMPRPCALPPTLARHAQREVPVAQSAPPLNLPWTLRGRRGIFGLDPIHGAVLAWAALMGFTLLLVILAALVMRWQWGRRNKREA